MDEDQLRFVGLVGADFDRLAGSNVQRYRTAKGVSQADLAAALSAGGEHVHQQTIQKIEKGTRPLKYSEALRICKVLAIDLEELTQGEAQADIKAEFLKMFVRLTQMLSELDDFAHRLVPILVELASYLALGRAHLKEFPVAEELVEEAEEWITRDWGKSLNTWISAVLRAHPHLVEIRPKYDALAYGEILKRVSENPWEPTSDEPHGGTDELAEDASET